MDKESMSEDKMESEMEENGACGCNAGMGNRAVAAHIRDVHRAANHSSDWVSSSTPPSRASIAHAPGAASYAKMPRATSRPIDD